MSAVSVMFETNQISAINAYYFPKSMDQILQNTMEQNRQVSAHAEARQQDSEVAQSKETSKIKSENEV